MLHNFGKWYGVVFYYVHECSLHRVEHIRISGDDSRLHTVASGEVLGGDDCYLVSCLGFYEQYLGMVVGKVGLLDYLTDKYP